MTKQRHCFVAQVGDAIEALASALDPEREPPFKGDILDLLEWAAKDVLEMNQRLEQAHADIAGLHDQLEEPQIAQDDYRLNKLELEQLRQQLAVVQAENLRLTAMPFASEAVRAVVYGRKIDELNQQLATANTAFDVVQKDCWNLTEKVIPNLRKQLADTEEKRADLEFVWNGCEPDLENCKAERDQLRQQLTSRDAEILELKNNVTICVVRMGDLRQQLAELKKQNEELMIELCRRSTK